MVHGATGSVRASEMSTSICSELSLLQRLESCGVYRPIYHTLSYVFIHGSTSDLIIIARSEWKLFRVR